MIEQRCEELMKAMWGICEDFLSLKAKPDHDKLKG